METNEIMENVVETVAENAEVCENVVKVVSDGFTIKKGVIAGIVAGATIKGVGMLVSWGKKKMEQHATEKKCKKMASEQKPNENDGTKTGEGYEVK